MGVTQNIDNTINGICNWIQQEMESDESNCKQEVIELTNALAALVTASASMNLKTQIITITGDNRRKE